MGSFSALNVTTWFAGYDMTGDSNSTSLAMSYEALDATPYQPVTNTNPSRVRVAGIEDIQLNQAGFWQSDTEAIDSVVVGALSGSQVVSNSPDGAEQSVAYFYRSKAFSYQPFGNSVGEVASFQFQAQGVRNPGLAAVGAVRGRVLKTRGDVSATGATGTEFELGAVGSGQYLYAGLHVFSAGTTITGVIESDDNSNFTSATTRITFSGITAVGGYWGTRVAGSVADTFYRLRISAVTGTFNIACVAGIR
jgi:hypothetical protein